MLVLILCVSRIFFVVLLTGSHLSNQLIENHPFTTLLLEGAFTRENVDVVAKSGMFMHPTFFLR